MNHQGGDRGHPKLELSLERTEYALERIHLAWMRTIITLILYGFALDKLVEVFHELRLTTGQALLKQAHITAIIFSLTGIILSIVNFLVGISPAILTIISRP